MSHPRSLIREAIVDKLKNTTSAKDRVYGNRSIPLFDQFLPAIIVYTKNENILEEKFTTDGYGATKRNLEIAIEAIVLGNEEVDDALDNISQQIEESLNNFEMPSRKADILKLKSTEIEISIEGSKTYGAIRLNYETIYYTKNEQ